MLAYISGIFDGFFKAGLVPLTQLRHKLQPWSAPVGALCVNRARAGARPGDIGPPTAHGGNSGR